MPNTILVATDLAPETKRLVEWALALPHGTDSRVILLHVVDVDQHVWAALSREYSVEDVRDRLLTIASDALADFQPAHPDDSPYCIESQVHWGKTSQVLVETAKAEEADLIVIGRHGPQTMAAMALGGTADKVLRTAHCAVTVLPMPG